MGQIISAALDGFFFFEFEFEFEVEGIEGRKARLKDESLAYRTSRNSETLFFMHTQRSEKCLFRLQNCALEHYQMRNASLMEGGTGNNYQAASDRECVKPMWNDLRKTRPSCACCDWGPAGRDDSNRLQVTPSRWPMFQSCS